MKKDCSNILVYKEEMIRMCAYFDDNCSDCKLSCDDCNDIMQVTPEYIEAVQKWSDEHPIKTRQSELLELFPNMEYEECLDYCPSEFEPSIVCNNEMSCVECKKEFWLKEVELV